MYNYLQELMHPNAPQFADLTSPPDIARQVMTRAENRVRVAMAIAASLAAVPGVCGMYYFCLAIGSGDASAGAIGFFCLLYALWGFRYMVGYWLKTKPQQHPTGRAGFWIGSAVYNGLLALLYIIPAFYTVYNLITEWGAISSPSTEWGLLALGILPASFVIAMTLGSIYLAGCARRRTRLQKEHETWLAAQSDLARREPAPLPVSGDAR